VTAAKLGPKAVVVGKIDDGAVTNTNLSLTTPVVNSNDASPATTAFVVRAIDNLISGATGTLTTLNAITNALQGNTGAANVISTLSTKADINGATLTSATLTSATLTSATLTNATLSGTIATGLSAGPVKALSNGNLSVSQITTSDIASNQVTMDKIGINAISTAKIQSEAITNDKIAYNAVQNLQIADGAVTNAKLSLTTVDASSNDASPATTAFVSRAINDLIDGAPAALNTLNEMVAALGGEAGMTSLISSVSDEVSARISAVSAVSSAIALETSNRASAITSAVSAEADARVLAVSAVSSAITLEATARASAITSAVSAEADARVLAVSAVSSAITLETSNRVSAITSAITLETSNRVSAVSSAVSAVSSAITLEATARASAITSAVSAEADARVLAVSAVSSAITLEAINRASAITSAVSDEATARASAITSAVSDEADARVSAIDSAITLEVTNRNSAITSAFTIAVPDITKFAHSSVDVSNNAIAITKSYHSLTVDVSANLITINGGSNGQLLTLDIQQPTSYPPTSYMVTIETSGNIVLNNNQLDFVLTHQNSILLMYRSSKWCEISRSVIRLAQLFITNALPSSLPIGGEPITLTTHISSDQTGTDSTPIEFAITSGSGTIDGSTFTPTNPGTVTITANQAGNGSTYSAAVPYPFEINVPPRAVLSGPASSIDVVVGEPITLTNHISSNQTGTGIVFAITSGDGAIDGSTFTAGETAGSVTITANQGNGSTYSAALPLTFEINVTLPVAVLSGPTSSIDVTVGEPITLTDHISSDQTGTDIVFTITSGGGSIVDSTFTAGGTTGSVTITANQAGNGTSYLAALPITMTVNVVVAMALFSGSGSLTNNRSVTVDFSNGENVIIACYEGEHVIVAHGSNSYLLVNYGGSVYTYSSGTLTKITVFPETTYPVYGGDGILGEGIAILVQTS
jgi:hypothetical protein